jgi:hypothetical protein
MTTESVHGSKVALSVDGHVISPWTTNSELKRAADKSEVTAYGAVGHAYGNDKGLKAHTFTASGWYDKTATTGTKAVLGGKEGLNLAVVWGEEGSDTGAPRATFNAHLDEFTTTAPVNDIVKWSSTWTVNGEITDDTY